MSTAEKGQRLKAVFAAILGLPVEQVGPDLVSETCEKWDSLNQIHLINAIEEEFGFTMDFEDQMRLLSFDVALDIVLSKGR